MYMETAFCRKNLEAASLSNTEKFEKDIWHDVAMIEWMQQEKPVLGRVWPMAPLLSKKEFLLYTFDEFL
jgi:hypothetical protein